MMLGKMCTAGSRDNDLIVLKANKGFCVVVMRDPSSHPHPFQLPKRNLNHPSDSHQHWIQSPIGGSTPF
ncbi:hypothetical protein J437_LFUL006604 [Ladona fulva]|uniref:Uncharacterized protein n=1 Tax=Ladona fulva TaxID=123851 RepID=A0A8K0P6D3_LADFU|nr:hypothetical protein J437_LFUL006604 [Ladona fulva]